MRFQLFDENLIIEKEKKIFICELTKLVFKKTIFESKTFLKLHIVLTKSQVSNYFRLWRMVYQHILNWKVDSLRWLALSLGLTPANLKATE